MNSVESRLAEIWKIRGEEQDEEIDKIIEKMTHLSRHSLSGGNESEINKYYDFDLITREPFNLRIVTRRYAAEVNQIKATEEIDVLGFIHKQGNTVGTLILAGAISMETGIPNVIVRLDKDLTLERIKPYVEDVKDSKPYAGVIGGYHGVIITDYLTKATEVSEAISTMKQFGCDVKHIVTFIERTDVKSPEKKSLKQRGIEIHAIRHVFYDSDKKI